MDVISRGLYGGIAVGRKGRKSYLLAFLLGMAPDIIAFGPYFLLVLFHILPRQNYSVEPPAHASMPAFVHIAYNFTHSLVIFALLFFVVWLIAQRPVWEMLAWGLHILVDIPTHDYSFFPTPFLWPVSHFEVNGHPWGTAIIFVPNVIIIVGLYAWWYFSNRYKHKKANPVRSDNQE